MSEINLHSNKMIGQRWTWLIPLSDIRAPSLRTPYTNKNSSLSVNLGEKYGKKYGQPVVAQLFGEARRTIEKAKVFNEVYNNAVRMVGLCCSDAYDFNCDRYVVFCL